jgi:hypothetical protein
LATIVDKGLEGIARIANGVLGGSPAYSYFDHLAIGTDNTAESTSDDDLGAEITTGGGARAAATVGYEADYKSTWVNTWTFSASFTITECGIFDGITPGAANSNMLMRHIFATSKSVSSGDQLQLTCKMTVSRV